MRYKFTLSIILLIPNLLYAHEPSGRGYDSNMPDLGLPAGDEVGIGLIVAIAAMLIGYLILNANKSDHNSDGNSAIGCIGVIFIGIGVVSLLPLLAWVCSILSTLFAVGVVVFVIIIIISLLKK